MLKNSKQFIKFSSSLLFLSTYFFTSLPFFILIYLSPYKTRKVLNRVVSFYSSVLLKFIGAKISIKGMEHFDKEKNYLIVSNHMSYLDILVLSSKIPTCFVTSYELKETPVLGQICTLGGCLFVERRSRKKILGEINQLENALNNNLNVLFFPEAKSTNGEEVIPFKRSLFQSSIKTNHPILATTLNYRTLNNEPLTKKESDLICWYDDMNFTTHLWKLCAYHSLVAEIFIHPEINPVKYENCTKKIRDKSFELISSEYNSFR